METKARRHYRSFKGFVTQSYFSQKKYSAHRGMPPPQYTKKEFSEWLLKNEKFNELWSEWVLNDYKTAYKPSIDRLDDYKTYSFDNIQLLTHRENLSKYYLKPHKAFKKVLQYTKEMDFIAEYESIKEAALKTNSSAAAISNCCKNKSKKSNGFIWVLKPVQQ